MPALPKRRMACRRGGVGVMKVELTREQLWAVDRNAIKHSAPKGDIERLEEGSPLRKCVLSSRGADNGQCVMRLQ